MLSRIVLLCLMLVILLNQVSVQAAPTECLNPVRCFADPCQVTTCKNYPNAKCRANYCGGCNADFYIGCRKVNCG